MSSLVYPVLPGLTFGNTRVPTFNTGVQPALSGKESRIAYQLYPLMTFELQYELLRDDIAVSELKALTGLFNAVQGQFDTFLYVDPAFNTVSNMQFGVTDGTTLSFQTTATYQNAGGPGSPEIIQNFNGAPFYIINRYGTLQEIPAFSSRTQFCLQSATYTSASWSKTNVTASLDGAIVAPDGSVPIALFDTTTSNVQHAISQGIASATAAGVYTFSIFVWNGGTEANFIVVQLQDVTSGTTCQANFNLITGAVTASGVSGVWSGIVAASSVVNASWNRLSITVTKTAGAGGIDVVLTAEQVSGSATYAGTVGAGVLALWGAQFESSAPGITFPTMYIPTTTTPVTQQDITGGATGVVTINAANFGSIAGIKLQWSGSFFYRVRFADDTLANTQFMNKWWQVTVKLQQVKL